VQKEGGGALDGIVAINLKGAALAVGSDGRVWKWGPTTWVDGSARLYVATPVSGLADVRQVASSSATGHVLALDGAGRVWSWGANAHGQTGDGTVEAHENIVQVTFPEPDTHIVSIAAGDEHSLAVDDQGRAWAWGSNARGALGDGSAVDRHSPVRVPPRWDGLDTDGDGLTNAEEEEVGTDPFVADTNEDGIPDGAAIAMHISATNLDMDGDGILNSAERAQGTDPFKADTDGDGVADGVDAFPLDPSRWLPPVEDPDDHDAPHIHLSLPSDAQQVFP
jgi:hypothetical protein